MKKLKKIPPKRKRVLKRNTWKNPVLEELLTESLKKYQKGPVFDLDTFLGGLNASLVEWINCQVLLLRKKYFENKERARGTSKKTSIYPAVNSVVGKLAFLNTEEKNKCMSLFMRLNQRIEQMSREASNREKSMIKAYGGDNYELGLEMWKRDEITLT